MPLLGHALLTASDLSWGVALATLHAADHNAVGLVDGRCIVFVRSRMLTTAALDVIAAEASRVVASTVRPIACLSVVPGDAGVSDKSLIERQQQMIGSFVVDKSTSFAMAVLGTSLQSRFMRTAVRMLFLGKSTLRLTDEVDDAVKWLSPRIAIEPQVLRDAVAALQSQVT